jgi:hypothetical protein
MHGVLSHKGEVIVVYKGTFFPSHDRRSYINQLTCIEYNNLSLRELITLKKVKIGGKTFSFINFQGVSQSASLPPIPAPAVVFLGEPINLRPHLTYGQGNLSPCKPVLLHGMCSAFAPISPSVPNGYGYSVISWLSTAQPSDRPSALRLSGTRMKCTQQLLP